MLQTSSINIDLSLKIKASIPLLNSEKNNYFTALVPALAPESKSPYNAHHAAAALLSTLNTYMLVELPFLLRGR